MFMLSIRQLQIAGGTFMLSNRHHDHLQIANLQIYPCKKQAGGTFMLSNRHHDSYKLA